MPLDFDRTAGGCQYVRAGFLQTARHHIDIFDQNRQIGRARILKARLRRLALDVFVIDQFNAQRRSGNLHHRNMRLGARACCPAS